MIGRPFLRTDIQAAAAEKTNTVIALEPGVEDLKRDLSLCGRKPAVAITGCEFGENASRD
jgi:hypothetical protein